MTEEGPLLEDQSRRPGSVAAAALGLLLVGAALTIGLLRMGQVDGQSTPTYNATVGDAVLATVNGEAIHQSDVQVMEDFMTGALRIGFDADPDSFLSPTAARTQALAVAITHTLLVQVAEAEGISISDVELESALRAENDATQADDRYHAHEKMQLYGWSSEEARSRQRDSLREAMLVDRLRERYRSEAPEASATEIAQAVAEGYPEGGVVYVIAIGFDDVERAARAYDELAPLNAAQDPFTFYQTFVDYGIAEGDMEPHRGYELEEYVASAQHLEQGDIGMVDSDEGAELFLVETKFVARPDEAYANAAEALKSRLQEEYERERVRQHLEEAEIVVLENATAD